MRRFITRLGGIALLGMIWFGVAGEGQAWWERPPVKVDTVFQFKVDINVGPQIQRPTAPWYSYFPADPNMAPSAQLTPYPTWPMQPPLPPGPPLDPRKDMLKKAGAATPISYWPGYTAPSSHLQPVSYAPMQAPSYWYQSR